MNKQFDTQQIVDREEKKIKYKTKHTTYAVI